MNNIKSVPSDRTARLAHYGRLAGGLAMGMAAEGVRQLVRGRIPDAKQMLLTPGNGARLTQRLSELRGAAMKVGQLLSMEAGDLLPRELTEVLSRLRQDAHQMTMLELNQVLEQSWGEGWRRQFRRFEFTPVAAASIGQVHRAVTADGRKVAIKVQYPGVRESIDADVANVGRLLGLLRLVPQQLDLDGLLRQAGAQLHEETDYRREARMLQAYARRLGRSEQFLVPDLLSDLSDQNVLSMAYIDGDVLDGLQAGGYQRRQQVAEALLQLALRELFDWGLVQTDPNFSNFRVDAGSGRIGLLDFGAVREYPADSVAALRTILTGLVNQDRGLVQAGAHAVGYTGPEDPEDYQNAIYQLLFTVSEPLRCTGAYDFGASDLSSRMREQVTRLRFESQYWRMPSTELLFLHRKLAGLYMLCSRFKVKLDVGELVSPYL